MNNNQVAQEFYEESYTTLGFAAQRRYPNEEFCRFMGRNFFHTPIDQRQNIKILETGCGSGANLYMIAKEGFDTYEVDISLEALTLCEQMLTKQGSKAVLQQQDMMNLEYSENFFDAIVDVFSSYCLNKKDGRSYIKSCYRTLKKGGIFFSYFPSKKSDSYQYPGSSELIDSDTLNGILRQDSPFSGQTYPFRFMHTREYESILREEGFEIQYCEEVTRTYRDRQEMFGFVVVEAVKK